MFLPNNRGMLSKRNGHSKTGEFLFGTPKPTQCSVVSLIQEIKKTPIRTDSSASRGHSDEDVSTSKILFPITAGIAIGDRFVIASLDLRCSGAQPRFNVLGTLDHIECTFEAWGQ